MSATMLVQHGLLGECSGLLRRCREDEGRCELKMLPAYTATLMVSPEEAQDEKEQDTGYKR